MQEEYEAPELTLIGEADKVVMGSAANGIDCPFQTITDFEFEQD